VKIKVVISSWHPAFNSCASMYYFQQNTLEIIQRASSEIDKYTKIFILDLQSFTIFIIFIRNSKKLNYFDHFKKISHNNSFSYTMRMKHCLLGKHASVGSRMLQLSIKSTD
jgi:hypothetical protein